MIKEKLGNIVSFQRGYDLTHGQMKGGSVPVVGSSEIIGWHNATKSEAPTLLIGRSGTVGRPQYYDCAVWPHNTTLFVKDFHDNNPKYCYYLLQNLNLEDYASSSGVPTLNRNFIEPLQVKYHKREEQDKIVKVLTALDDKILTNTKIIESSEKLMREIYDYWFVQFDFPDENGRPYKSSGGEIVYNETLKREIPKGWKVVNIEDLAQLTWGQCPDGVNILDKDSEAPSLPYCSGAGDMDGGYIVNCQARTDNSRREVESGTILLSIAGTIGKMAIANEKISLGRATLGIAPNDKKYYALVWLLLKMYNSRLKTASVGAVQKIINKSNMRELNIAIPDVDDMNYEALNSTMEIIKSLSLENDKLASLHDWLLPMLMNGQVSIKG